MSAVETPEVKCNESDLSDETFVSPLDRQDLGPDFNDIYPSMCSLVRDLDMRLLEYTMHYKDIVWKKNKEIEELKKVHSQEIANKNLAILSCNQIIERCYKELDKNDIEIRKLKSERTKNIITYSKEISILEADVEKKDTKIKVLKEILEKNGLNTDAIQSEIQDKIKEYERKLYAKKLRDEYGIDYEDDIY
jgi:hypothetical protein